MADFPELVKSLNQDQQASLSITESGTQRQARTLLIEAARRANVRISMKRDGDLVVAKVLDEKESDAQWTRDTIFRGVNKIKEGTDILTMGTIDVGPIDDTILDLRDIVHELEEYAQGLVSGATG